MVSTPDPKLRRGSETSPDLKLCSPKPDERSWVTGKEGGEGNEWSVSEGARKRTWSGTEGHGGDDPPEVKTGKRVRRLRRSRPVIGQERGDKPGYRGL